MSSSHSMNSYENDSSSGGSGIRTINRLIKMKKILLLLIIITSCGQRVDESGHTEELLKRAKLSLHSMSFFALQIHDCLSLSLYKQKLLGFHRWWNQFCNYQRLQHWVVLQANAVMREISDLSLIFLYVNLFRIEKSGFLIHHPLYFKKILISVFPGLEVSIA